MVAPHAETLFTGRRRVAGVLLFCPECPPLLGPLLRIETLDDYPSSQAPDLVRNAGPLGFIARCDRCGFRVEMKGNRLPTVMMLRRGGEVTDVE